MISRRWPIHPLPHQGESLSSWIERLARAYGYELEDLLTYDLGFQGISVDELDIDPPELLLMGFFERTGVPLTRLRTMTVRGWVPLLIDGLEPDSNRFSTYIGGHSLLYPISLRGLHTFDISDTWIPWLNRSPSNGRLACRLCLKNEPMRRLSWRMGWMTTCPTHGVMLEDIHFVAGEYIDYSTGEPTPAPPELLALDRLTAQAIEAGCVSLPRRNVHGGVWVRLLRALLEELSIPVLLLRGHRGRIKQVWNRLGLEVRQGVRNIRVPFETMEFKHQRLLMGAAGVAIEMLMKGSFKRAGDDAFLLRPLPISDADLPSAPIQPGGKELQEKGGRSAYERAWTNVSNAISEVEVAMRHSLDTTIEMRNFLLGSNPTPEKIETIDRMFREQGYLLPDDVI